jgi:hypothetical protein
MFGDSACRKECPIHKSVSSSGTLDPLTIRQTSALSNTKVRRYLLHILSSGIHFLAIRLVADLGSYWLTEKKHIEERGERG